MKPRSETRLEPRNLWRSLDPEIEYIGSEDDGTIEAISFFIVKEFKTYLGVPTEWLEKMDKDQISKRLKYVAEYGKQEKRNHAQEIVDSLSEFELWFDKALPDSALEIFVKNTLHSNMFFKRGINYEGQSSKLKIYRLLETEPVEILKDRGEETFRTIFGRILLGGTI